MCINNPRQCAHVFGWELIWMDVDPFKPPRSWKLALSEPPLAFKSDLLLCSGDGPNVSASFMVHGGYQPNWTLFILQLPLIKHKLMRPTPRFSGPAPATVAAVVTPAFLTAEYITWCISSQTSRSCMSTNDLENSIVFPAFLLIKEMGMGGVFCETRARTGELFLLMASKKKLKIRVCFLYKWAFSI